MIVFIRPGINGVRHNLRMTSDKKNILFITPSLAATGSEMLLFQFITYLAPRYHITVITYTEGSLIKSLPKSVKVHVLHYSEAKSVFQKIKRRIKIHFSIPLLFSKYKKYNWYINTIILPFAVNYAISHKISYVLHCHELKQRYLHLKDSELRTMLDASKLVIANASLAKFQLEELGTTKQIAVINPFIDRDLIQTCLPTFAAAESKSGSWTMAGSIDENKNPKLFLNIARESIKQGLSHTFCWLYTTISDEPLFNDIQKIIQEEQLPLKFIKTSNYLDYINHLALAKGLLLTSGYESFSLVSLECMTLGLPLVVNDCGGVNELLDNKLASIIPLNSNLNLYLEAMDKELQRVEETRLPKMEMAKRFDKKTILADWEKLMLLSLN